MDLVYQCDKECTLLARPMTVRVNSVKSLRLGVIDWYDKKGKGKDIHEVILKYDGNYVYFYDENTSLEEYIELKFVSGENIDLTGVDAHRERLSIPRSYRQTKRVVD